MQPLKSLNKHNPRFFDCVTLRSEWQEKCPFELNGGPTK